MGMVMMKEAKKDFKI